MFENSVAQQQSPQSFRPGQTPARRSPAAVQPNLGSAAADSPSSGGQQRLKNAINLGKAVGAKVSGVKLWKSPVQCISNNNYNKLQQLLLSHYY